MEKRTRVVSRLGQRLFVALVSRLVTELEHGGDEPTQGWPLLDRLESGGAWSPA
jgi:hypothetical protein